MYYFIFNGERYTHSPYYPIMTGWNEAEPIFGDVLKDVLGMTDEQAEVAHAEGLLNEIRYKRDEKIRETDWVSGEDVPQSLKDKWYPYRQALRDITDHYSSLEDVIWPTKPDV